MELVERIITKTNENVHKLFHRLAKPTVTQLARGEKDLGANVEVETGTT